MSSNPSVPAMNGIPRYRIRPTPWLAVDEAGRPAFEPGKPRRVAVRGTASDLGTLRPRTAIWARFRQVDLPVRPLSASRRGFEPSPTSVECSTVPETRHSGSAGRTPRIQGVRRGEEFDIAVCDLIHIRGPGGPTPRVLSPRYLPTPHPRGWREAELGRSSGDDELHSATACRRSVDDGVSYPNIRFIVHVEGRLPGVCPGPTVVR